MKMSDGVYNMVSKAEMCNTIASLPLSKALHNGANDNVSVILVNGVLAAYSPVRAQSDLPQNPVR
jgi:serine/threonine protein phosphatase PrpC